jgi:hypothetical protein
MQLTENREPADASVAPGARAAPSPSTDLFDTYAAWRREPVAAFEAWIRRRGLSASSCAVYLDMWRHLERSMSAHHAEIGQWSVERLAHFIERETLPNRYRARFLFLIERVFHHLGELGHNAPNPAFALRHVRAESPEGPTRFLSRRDRTALISYCKRRTAALINQRGIGQATWVEWRDLALVALALGAGLKTYDLQVASVSCIDAAEGMVRPRPRAAFRAPLEAFAVPIVARWLIVHREQGFDAAILFPAVRSKGAFSPRDAGTLHLHKASMFRRIRAVMLAAGVELAPADAEPPNPGTNGRLGRSMGVSGQTLRNTYASLLFDAGLDDDEVMLRMGFRRHTSVERLRAAWEKRQLREAASRPVATAPALTDAVA